MLLIRMKIWKKNHSYNLKEGYFSKIADIFGASLAHGPKIAKVHDLLDLLEYSIFISLFVPGPKVFATEADYHEFDGYSEEVLALAIVMTAFVALVIGKNEILFQLWNF